MERGLEFHAQTKFKETTFMGRSSFHIMQNDEVEKAVHIPLKQSINQIKRKGHRNCTYRVHAPYVQQYFCNLSSCSSLYIYRASFRTHRPMHLYTCIQIINYK